MRKKTRIPYMTSWIRGLECTEMFIGKVHLVNTKTEKISKKEREREGNEEKWKEVINEWKMRGKKEERKKE